MTERDHVADRASGVVTADGAEHEVDCIIYGTGFRTNDFMFPMAITGAGGRSLRRGLGAAARTRTSGMTVPGFPSMFVMYGPEHEHLGRLDHRLPEAQAAYIRQALAARRATAARRRSRCAPRSRPPATPTCRPRSPARRGRAATRGTATPDGRIVANWPDYMRDYFERTRVLEPAEFELLEA